MTANGTGTGTKVAVGFAGFENATEENGVFAFWGSECKLIKCQTFTTSFYNTSACTVCEAKGTDGHFWYGLQTYIVGNGTYNNADFGGFVVFLHVALHAGESHWWSVDARHEQTFKNNLIELGIGTT